MKNMSVSFKWFLSTGGEVVRRVGTLFIGDKEEGLYFLSGDYPGELRGRKIEPFPCLVSKNGMHEADERKNKKKKQRVSRQAS